MLGCLQQLLSLFDIKTSQQEYRLYTSKHVISSVSCAGVFGNKWYFWFSYWLHQLCLHIWLHNLCLHIWLHNLWFLFVLIFSDCNINGIICDARTYFILPSSAPAPAKFLSGHLSTDNIILSPHRQISIDITGGMVSNIWEKLLT